MMDEMRLSSITKGLEYPTNVGKPDPLHRREEKVMADQSGVQGTPVPRPRGPSHVMADGLEWEKGGASRRTNAVVGRALGLELGRLGSNPSLLLLL